MDGGTDKALDRGRNEAAPGEEAAGKDLCDGHLQRSGDRASRHFTIISRINTI